MNAKVGDESIDEGLAGVSKLPERNEKGDNLKLLDILK